MTPRIDAAFPPSASAMPSRDTLIDTLIARAEEHPYLPAATLIFLLAIIHTFLAPRFLALAHRLEHEAHARDEKPGFVAGICHFLGEVEAVFGIWSLALFALLLFWPGIGFETATEYLNGRNYAEAVFVVIIMAMAATRPVVVWAGAALGKVAELGKSTPFAWWMTILTIAPLLGSFITEPAAMTLAALLLLRRVYAFNPSPHLSYATLALLFVNVSVGGTLTNFAAPPVLMVAANSVWDWTTPDMLANFGWKAVIGIVAANSIIGYIFRREFAVMATKSEEVESIVGDSESRARPPVWVLLTHLGFMAWTVVSLLQHHTALSVGGMLFFLAFTTATAEHQDPVQLRPALLVGFFLGGLVIHGGLQAWWIGPVLGSLGEWPLFFGSAGLTAFNDNAAITFLASQVPAFSIFDPATGAPLVGAAHAAVSKLHFAVLAGAVTGGGLTVIANAPNPAGLAILGRRFEDGVSPLKLFLWALPPTIVMGAAFMLLPG